MADWQKYRGLDVPDVPLNEAGIKLKDDLQILANGAPHASSSNPTVNEDSNDGFASGALWWNTTDKILWVCTDASVGAAKWRSLFRRVDNAIVLAPDPMVGSGTDNRALQFDFDVSHAVRGANAIDLQRVRSASTQVAAGNQSAILGGENNTAFSIGSFVAGGKGNSAGGGFGTITNNSAASPTVVTSNNHGLVTGATIVVSGSNSNPSIDGTRIVTVTGTNTFTVPVNVSSGGSAGDWTTNASAAYAFVGGGQNNKALGKFSHAQGSGTAASGSAAHSEGVESRATGSGSHAEGSSHAQGIRSHAEGLGCLASGNTSHAEGCQSTASGTYAHAEGGLTTATGYISHAEGHYSNASGNISHAEGHYCVASNSNCHAEGNYSTASGPNSHAEGSGTTASGSYSHAEGAGTVASTLCAHAGGFFSKARLRAQWARASGGHSFQVGSAQTTITQLFRSTTNDTPTELTLDGGAPSGSNRFVVSIGQTLSCFINIVGRKIDADSAFQASFLRQVCVCRKVDSTELVDTAKTIGVDIKPSGWDVAVAGDDDNSSLKITVTGGAATTNVRWMATVIASEVTQAAV